MSDTWYRDPDPIPPYEDWHGNLWTWDGVCLNPVHTCEPPSWYHELLWQDIVADYHMGLAEWKCEYLGVWQPE